VLAKRHYHETGAMRWFDVNVVPVDKVVEVAAHFNPGIGAIGQFLLAIPTDNESEDSAMRFAARRASQPYLGYCRGDFQAILGDRPASARAIRT